MRVFVLSFFRTLMTVNFSLNSECGQKQTGSVRIIIIGADGALSLSVVALDRCHSDKYMSDIP